MEGQRLHFFHRWFILIRATCVGRATGCLKMGMFAVEISVLKHRALTKFCHDFLFFNPHCPIQENILLQGKLHYQKEDNSVFYFPFYINEKAVRKGL